MKVAYTAGPYRSPVGAYGVARNIRAAEEVAVELWRMGYAVICPHKNTAFFDGAADDSVWLEGDLELLSRSDLVVMVPGWESSAGATEEHGVAGLHDIPIYYWPADSGTLRILAAETAP